MILAQFQFDVALFPPWPELSAVPATCTLFAPVLFVPFLFRFRFIRFKPDPLPAAELKWADFIQLFSDLHPTKQSCVVLAYSSKLAFTCPDRPFHTTTIGPSFSPQKSKSPCPADCKKGRGRHYCFFFNSRGTFCQVLCNISHSSCLSQVTLSLTRLVHSRSLIILPHANWKEWKPLMQSAMHSVVLGHILAGANMDFTGADLLSAWIYQPKPALFCFCLFSCPRGARLCKRTGYPGK